MTNKNVITACVLFFLIFAIGLIIYLDVYCQKDKLENSTEISKEIENKESINETIIEDASQETVNDESKVYDELTKREGDIPERSFKSYADFPYYNLEYVNDETFEFLKTVYNDLDFYGAVDLGDTSLYEEYKEKFRQLLNNEVMFKVSETDEVCYIKDYVHMDSTFMQKKSDGYNPHGFIYYIFDIDGDNAPELCMYNFQTYIFKYDAKSDSFSLWNEINSPYKHIHATNMMRQGYKGELEHIVYWLDGNGQVNKKVWFLLEGFHSNGNLTWLVTVPVCEDKNDEVELTYELKEQAYFCEKNQVYMFRVTEEQYDELTKNYFVAINIAKENLNEVRYTYDSLYNAGEICEICNRLKKVS